MISERDPRGNHGHVHRRVRADTITHSRDHALHRGIQRARQGAPISHHGRACVEKASGLHGTSTKMIRNGTYDRPSLRATAATTRVRSSDSQQMTLASKGSAASETALRWQELR